MSGPYKITACELPRENYRINRYPPKIFPVLIEKIRL